MAYPNRADLNDAWDENPDHEADDLRQRDYQDLIEQLAIERPQWGQLGSLVMLAGYRMRGGEWPYCAMTRYAQMHGWADVLRALASLAQDEQAESSAPRA